MKPSLNGAKSRINTHIIRWGKKLNFWLNWLHKKHLHPKVKVPIQKNTKLENILKPNRWKRKKKPQNVVEYSDGCVVVTNKKWRNLRRFFYYIKLTGFTSILTRIFAGCFTRAIQSATIGCNFARTSPDTKNRIRYQLRI